MFGCLGNARECVARPKSRRADIEMQSINVDMHVVVVVPCSRWSAVGVQTPAACTWGNEGKWK